MSDSEDCSLDQFIRMKVAGIETGIQKSHMDSKQQMMDRL